MENKKAIVIGGGVSGLSAAIGLKNRGFDVTVLEKNPRAGGVIATVSKDGFRAESGTNSVMIQSRKTLDFIDSLGLKDRIAYSKPVQKKRYFVRYGKIRAVPTGPFAFLFTRLFSFCGKIRMLMEPWVEKEDPESDPSVSEFACHRLGRDGLDYALNPLMAGIYGGSTDRLSIRHAFPPFWNLVQKYGSIIGGAMKSMKEKKAAGNIFKPMVISFKDGMGELISTMEDKLKGDIKYNAKIISIDMAENGWNVEWGNKIEDSADIYDALVIAVPSTELSTLPLPGTLSAMLAPLKRIEYAPVATYTLGFRREDVRHKLDGFGVLIPEKENMHILGSLFQSTIFDNRAPEGCVTLTNYVGGMRSPKLARLGEEEQEKLIMEDLKKLLGVKGEPVFKQRFLWEHAIAQYNVGYQEFLDLMDNVEAEFPSLALVGSYRKGVGVSSCIENGLAAAAKISARV